MSRFAWLTLLATVACLMVGIAAPVHLTAYLVIITSIYFFLVVLGVVFARFELFVDGVFQLDSHQPVVALTFDDGPDPRSTPVLLDLLDELNVSATFFCVGTKVRRHPHIASSIVKRGHTIANHSYNHFKWMNCKTGKWLSRDICLAQRAIVHATGIQPRLYRSPMGLTNPHLRRVLADERLTYVGWTVRSLDTLGLGARWTANRVLARLRPNAIVLMHDGGQEAQILVQTVRLIIDSARKKGYIWIALDRLNSSTVSS